MVSTSLFVILHPFFSFHILKFSFFAWTTFSHLSPKQGAAAEFSEEKLSHLQKKSYLPLLTHVHRILLVLGHRL